jgi:hypothetical protein
MEIWGSGSQAVSILSIVSKWRRVIARELLSLMRIKPLSADSYAVTLLTELRMTRKQNIRTLCLELYDTNPNTIFLRNECKKRVHVRFLILDSRFS